MSYNVAMGRKIERRHKVQSDSLVEIKRGLRAEADRLSDEKLTFDGHGIWPGNALNFLLCWYLSQSPEERSRIAIIGRHIFAEHRDSERPYPFEERTTTEITVAGRSLNPNTGETIDVSAKPQKKDTA